MVGTRRKLSGILATVVSAIALDIAALLIAAPTAVAATYVLQNGAPVYLAGAAGSSQNFSLTVPSGAIDLSFNIYGGTGDADLYVKFGSAPTVASFDCRPFKTGNNETCPLASPQTGTYYVMVYGYSSFSGVDVVGTFNSVGVLSNGVPASVPTTPAGGRANYTMVVPSGKTSLSVKISGGSGDADLYVRRGSPPTTIEFDCRPYDIGNTETCTFSAPTGTWYVMVRAYATFSGVNLIATYS
jgi:hypothetical protein